MKMAKEYAIEVTKDVLTKENDLLRDEKYWTSYEWTVAAGIEKAFTIREREVWEEAAKIAEGWMPDHKPSVSVKSGIAETRNGIARRIRARKP